MSDFINIPVAALLILLGAIGIFLWIGGESENFRLPDTVPDKRRRLIGFGGGFFLVIGLLLGIMPFFALLSADEAPLIESTSRPSPTNTIQVVLLENTFTPGSTTSSPDPIAVVAEEPTVTKTAVSPTTLPDPTDLLTKTATAVPTPIPTNSPEPTANPTETETAVPTPSPTNTPPLPTNTVTVTSTQTLEVLEIPIQVRTNTKDVGVFYGPSTENSRASILKFNEVVQVIGKVRGSLFYEVLLENGITGWVEGGKVDFVTGADEEVPLTWPRTGTVSNNDTGSSGSSASISACSLRIWTEENQVDDVFIHWSSLPQDTRWLYLKVQGTLNGRITNLIEPNTIDATDVDTQENGFILGSWRFDPNDPSWKGFPENTQFTFTLEAQDVNRNGICAKSGTFTQ